MQEGGEGRSVVFGYAGLERIREGGCILKTVQHIEHAEAFAGIRWHGEHAHLHTGFQFLVGIRHVLRQRLLAGREKQQAPLLHLSARLSSIIRPGLIRVAAEAQPRPFPVWLFVAQLPRFLPVRFHPEVQAIPVLLAIRSVLRLQACKCGVC